MRAVGRGVAASAASPGTHEAANRDYPRFTIRTLDTSGDNGGVRGKYDALCVILGEAKSLAQTGHNKTSQKTVLKLPQHDNSKEESCVASLGREAVQLAIQQVRCKVINNVQSITIQPVNSEPQWDLGRATPSWRGPAPGSRQ